MGSETAAEPTKRSGPLHFTDLPREIQKEIVSHCSQADLICLSLVSKHFQDLAAAELYRNFHIVFPDEDDPAYDSPVDGLAGGLETFVTSDYDYAKHLRDISLDTLSSGIKAEQAYKPYVYNVSCGKFMNTLLLLTLRKAKALEKFRWNIRVELSRPVYKALHQIDTLTHLRIRLQIGPSLYETPPPLPLYSPSSSPNGSTNHLPIFDHSFTQSPFSLPPPPPPFYIPPPTSLLPPPPPPPKPSKTRAWKKPSQSSSPPTLSGFKGLKSLAILDIDNLEVVTELRQCIRNSQGTLNKLKLSFSSSLAMRARKPPPETDPDDSDPDDEFQVVPVPAPPPLPSYDDANGPAKALRAQEEKKTQEAVLGRIFGLEPYVIKTAKKSRDKQREAPKHEQSSAPGQHFVSSLKDASNKLMAELNGSEDLTAAQQDWLETIVAAAKKYVSEEEFKKATSKDAQINGQPSTESDNGESASKSGAADTQSSGLSLFGTNSSQPSLFGNNSNSVKDNQQDASPEDIDIEAPIEDSSIEEASDAGAPDAASSDEKPALTNGKPTKVNGSAEKGNEAASEAVLVELSQQEEVSRSVSTAAANIDAQKGNFKKLEEKLESYEKRADRLQKEINAISVESGPEALKKLREAERQTEEFSRNIKDTQQEMAEMAAEIQDAEKQIRAAAETKDADGVRKNISTYNRDTRGLSLQTFSVHLIPVKPRVLSDAIDLHVLNRITLLNVGNQAPIWTLLMKKNQEAPLALRKIFTDNVSPQFLNFVNQLSELHELFMLERPEKYKPESFAPRTTVGIDKIRKLALKKHMGSLKRLVIKNQNDTTWDLDTRTTSLICRRGKALEELAVSLSIREIHTLLQQIQQLTSLRALHIINLRNDDTCVWVMRETRRFVIDTLSHFPEMKIEWLAIDDDEHVERIVRWKEPPREKKAKSKKGKEKAQSTLANGSQFPVLNLDNPEAISDSDEDYGSSAEEGISRIETIDNIHFYDVWGVRIFKREVITGRL